MELDVPFRETGDDGGKSGIMYLDYVSIERVLAN